MSGTLKVVGPAYPYCAACGQRCFTKFEAIGRLYIPYKGRLMGVGASTGLSLTNAATADLCATCAAPFLPPPAAGVGTFVATAAHGPTNVTVTDDDTVPPKLVRLGSCSGDCRMCTFPHGVFIYKALQMTHVQAANSFSRADIPAGAQIALCRLCAEPYIGTQPPSTAPPAAPRCGCGSTSTYGTQAYAIGHSDYCPVRAT